jgi:type IV secretion system protein VirB10
MNCIKFAAIGTLCALMAVSALAQAPDRDFTGEWQLNGTLGDKSIIPSGFLHVQQAGATMTVNSAVEEGSPLVTLVYPLDSRTVKNRAGDSTVSIATKWEGAALLVNAIVSGPEDYSINDRWSRSRDGNKLTIERSIVRRSGEKESVLEYRVAGYAPPPVSSTVAPTRPPGQALIPRAPSPVKSDQPLPDYVLTAGTRILLRLTNSVDTKRSVAGDRVYLETAAPVFLNGRLIIPQGSFVIGSITEAQRPGRVKGKAALNLRFETITLPNGVARDLLSRADSADTRGKVDSEGRIQGDGSRGRDAATVAGTTAAGAGIGAIAGAPGIGAAAGAVAGLAGILGTRGPDLVVRQGTTMEMVLDRDLTFSSLELPGR